MATYGAAVTELIPTVKIAHQTLDAGEIALAQGTWVKLICGASNQDLTTIADLCALFAVAGVHCVDVAADAAVVHAARDGLDWAWVRMRRRPWLMVSVSDGSDAHFRKAAFNPERCPPDCSRPCEKVCPANAIRAGEGVDEQLCYGCGRCWPACPLQLIHSFDRRIGINQLATLLRNLQPDALEIHTAPGRLDAFQCTVEQVCLADVPLRRLSVSCGLEGHHLTLDSLSKELWQRHDILRFHHQRPLWQLDGRPMSGDLGVGTAHAAVKLWKRLQPLAPPGPLQLAGGTNHATIGLVDAKGSSVGPAGVAFGGIARTLIQPFLQAAQERGCRLRDWPDGWTRSLQLVQELVVPWLQRN